MVLNANISYRDRNVKYKYKFDIYLARSALCAIRVIKTVKRAGGDSKKAPHILPDWTMAAILVIYIS